VWLGFCAVDVPPSPKSQSRAVIGDVPGVEVSVKFTVSGASPVVGVPVKSATGAIGTIEAGDVVRAGAVIRAHRVRDGQADAVRARTM